VLQAHVLANSLLVNSMNTHRVDHTDNSYPFYCVALTHTQ